LFDAGVGVQRRLAAAGLPINGVTAAFITHLHSDHVLGLPDLILSSWTFGRTRPFALFGPSGLRPMVEHLYEAFREDIANREAEYGARGGYQVETRVVRPGVVYDSGGVRVTAIDVEHGQWREAYGYRIDTPTRSIVISGDTRPSEELVRMAAGVDVLIHEVHPAGVTQIGNRPAVDWPRYISEHHTTSTQLGEIAARANPKLLILYHNGRRATAEQLIVDIRKAFSGPIAIAEDLQRY
jgi:ribonuclease Z